MKFTALVGIMGSMLASSAEDSWVRARSSQTKDYIIDMCCFSAKHAALWEKNKYLLDRNQDNVSEWGDMTIRELLIQ